MTQVSIPGSKHGARVLAVTRRLIPACDREIVGESATVGYQFIMDEQQVATDTLRSSTNVSPGEPVGRNLTYGPGNTPLPVTIVGQALAARRLGEPLILSEDARSPEGFPYGLKAIEPRFRTFGRAVERIRSQIARIIARAVGIALKEAFS